MEIFRLFGSVLVNNAEALASLGKIEKKFETVGEKFEKVGKNLTTKLTLPIVGIGAAAFKFASDVEDAAGAADQIFNEQSERVKGWARELENYYGIAESEALTYANTMGAMLKNIGGLSEEEAAKQSATLVELAGDLTAMFGGTTESAVQALTGALKGNNAMLDNYGMGVNDATIKAKAFEMGLYSGTGAMELSAKQAATLALIMEQTADAQGQAAREADGGSGSMRGLATELKNVAGQLGQHLLPLITPFIAKIRDLVEGFGNLSPNAQKTIVTIAGIVAAIGPALLIIGKLTKGIGLAVGAFKTISAAIGVATTGAAAATPAIATMGKVIGALTGPIGIAVAAIVAIGAVILHLWRTNEEFRDNVKALWETLKEFFVTITDAIRAIFDTFVAIVEALWDKHGESIKAIIEPLWEAIKVVVETTIGVIQGIISTVLALIQGDWGAAWDGVKKIFSTVWEGMKNLLPALLEGIFAVMRGAFDIFKDIGKGMFDMVWEGMKGIWSSVSSWISDKVSWLTDKLFFWRKSKSELEQPVQATPPPPPPPAQRGFIDGSHATGLSYVPYDGYVAELHRGEAVLTKEQNARGGQSVVFDRGAFEGAILFDDYGIDRLMDRIRFRLGELGV